MKGSYVLIIQLDQDRTIKIGKKQQKMFFKKGYYAYIGSAMNGLEQRIKRHLRKNKKFHWHIDYLLCYSKIKKVYYLKSNKQEECKIAGNFEKKIENIPGFGCTDCKCKSHLFYGKYENIINIVNRLKMTKYFDANT